VKKDSRSAVTPSIESGAMVPRVFLLPFIVFVVLACADDASNEAAREFHRCLSLGLAIFNGSDSSVAVDSCGARAIVGIERPEVPFPESWCTGVVVQETVVVTAGHCVLGRSSGPNDGDGGDSGIGNREGGLATPVEGRAVASGAARPARESAHAGRAPSSRACERGTRWRARPNACC
jgi:hypothetical protein